MVYSEGMSAPYGVPAEAVISGITTSRRAPGKKAAVKRARADYFKEADTAAAGGAVVSFERTDDLYTYDLDGNVITPDTERRASPLCPLCNHEEWEAIDHLLLGGASVRDVKEYCGNLVTEMDIMNHQVRHLAPVAREVVQAFFPSLNDIPDEAATKGFRKQVSRLAKAAEDIESYESSAERIARSRFTRVVNDDPHKRFRARPTVAFSGDGVYAMQGEHSFPFKIWSRRRMDIEVGKREKNTITFLGELMNVRKMAYRVYNETMDTGDAKYYGTAVSALREIRGVVETLGKFSLIAKQLGDDSGKRKSLSPQMQDMIAKLGISVSADTGESVSPEFEGMDEDELRDATVDE